jgi:hypothetical protein
MRRLIDLNCKEMNIVTAYPPNIAEIELVFPGVKANLNGAKQIYFCYGNTIYNPSGRPLEKYIIAHEVLHSMQQADTGVEMWWDRYLADPEFRFQQELEAHCVEYEQYRLENPGRAFRRRYIAILAERLSGPLYGRVVSKAQAMELIKEEVW